MKSKTILFINSEGLPFGFSASANKIRYIGEIFAQSQIDVYCLNKLKGGSDRRVGYHKGIRFAFFNTKMKSNNLFQVLTHVFHAFIKEFFFVKKKTSNYEERYILLQYDWFPIFLYYWLFSKVFNLKIIVNIMEWHISVPSSSILVRINKYLFDNLSFKMASGAIPISKFIERKIYAINKNLPSFVLPAITDFNEIKTIDIGAFSAEKYLLYCGNLGYIEVINFIVEAYSKIENRNIKLLLVVNGKKNEFEELEKLIQKWKIQSDVIIKTNLSFQSLITTYKNAIGLLIPLRNTEQDLARFPHKISEYTATKRPIITTGFGVINDYFNNENAFICTEYSSLEYAKLIDKVINNPLKANYIGLNGYKLGSKELNTKAYHKTLPEFLISI